MTERSERGIPAYVMLDVWMALGGDSLAFDRMWDEDRRSPADTWSQLLGVIRGGDLADDHNPPAGPEFDALLARRSARRGSAPADERPGDRMIPLPRFLRRCRCFHRPLGAGVLLRVPLEGCPKHGGYEHAFRDVKHYLEWEVDE